MKKKVGSYLQLSLNLLRAARNFIPLKLREVYSRAAPSTSPSQTALDKFRCNFQTTLDANEADYEWDKGLPVTVVRQIEAHQLDLRNNF